MSDLTWNTEVRQSVNHVTLEILDRLKYPHQGKAKRIRGSLI